MFLREVSGSKKPSSFVDCSSTHFVYMHLLGGGGDVCQYLYMSHRPKDNCANKSLSKCVAVRLRHF